MKKVKAFIVACLLMFITIFGYHSYINGKLEFNNNKFSTWIDSMKFKSPDIVKSNINKDTIVVFGSSELNHCKNTKYHPENMFKDNKFNMMLIGEGYDQCLFHTTALAALDEGIKDRKVVLILSPQWFRKGGVKPKAYASRFSEANFVEMLNNPRLSDEEKRYIINRSKKLLVDDKKMLDKIKMYERIILDKNGNLIDDFTYKIDSFFLKEKQNQSIVSRAILSNIEYDKNKSLKNKEIDWDKYLLDAEEEGMKEANNNEFAIKNRYYDFKLKGNLDKRKDKKVKTGYSVSKEYEDFEHFLRVCKELKIEPLIVSIPVNGKWYDYTGFTQEKRQEYYDNIKDIVNKYDVELVDFSDREYEDYFLEDTIHLGWKGWVNVNEQIYKFNYKDKK